MMPDIEAWEAARNAAPTKDELAEQNAAMLEKKAVYDELKDETRDAALEYAAVYGIPAAAEVMGVSLKQMYVWRTRYKPDLVDLSKIPAEYAEWQRKMEERLQREKERAEERVKRDVPMLVKYLTRRPDMREHIIEEWSQVSPRALDLALAELDSAAQADVANEAPNNDEEGQGNE